MSNGPSKSNPPSPGASGQPSMPDKSKLEQQLHAAGHDTVALAYGLTPTQAAPLRSGTSLSGEYRALTGEKVTLASTLGHDADGLQSLGVRLQIGTQASAFEFSAPIATVTSVDALVRNNDEDINVRVNKICAQLGEMSNGDLLRMHRAFERSRPSWDQMANDPKRDVDYTNAAHTAIAVHQAIRGELNYRLVSIIDQAPAGVLRRVIATRIAPAAADTSTAESQLSALDTDQLKLHLAQHIKASLMGDFDGRVKLAVEILSSLPA